MKFAIAAACLFAGTLAPAFAQTAPAAPLAITIHGESATARSLDHYASGTRLAVDVAAPGHAADAVTLVARNPNGATERTTLARSANGDFTGEIALADAGSWSIALDTRTGSIDTTTSPIPLSVTAPADDQSWLVGLAVGLGIFIVIGGLGFLILRRRPADGDVDRAQAA